MKKILKLATLSCLSLFADDCCEPTCCDWDFCGGTYNVGADWLYWKTEQDSLDAASFIDDRPGDFKIVNFSAIQPSFKYTSGFRVFAGYEFPCETWGFEVSYTYIPIRSHPGVAIVTLVPTATHFQEILGNQNDFPVFAGVSTSNTGMQNPFTSLTATWHGKLSYLDVDLTRRVCLGSCFFLLPHIGFRAAWGDQHFRMRGPLQFPAIMNNATFADLDFTTCFHGYGIEGGLWMDWKFGWGISALGHVGSSILGTTFKARQKTSGSLGENGTPAFVIDGTVPIHTMIPTLDLFAGLQYCYTFCNDMSLGIHAGWEEHVFFDLNRFAISRGNFYTQGLTLGGEFTF